MKFQGMFASVATPFDYSGALYRTKIQHNFEKWCRTALAGFVVGSLAGEGPLLEGEEKIALLEIAASHIGGDRTIILDVSSEGVHAAAKLARCGADAGAHAVISVAPNQYRNVVHGHDARSLFFRALADQSPIPVLIHNGPPITGVDLHPETMARLADHPNIRGVLETGTPPSRIAQIRELARKDFVILTGTESELWEALKAGANGAALAMASAAPYATIAIWEAFRTREEEAGLDWQRRISHPSLLVTDLYGVPGLKHAMDLNGYYGGIPRLPFVPVSSQAQREIEEAFHDLRG
jgi:4-hydroxy-2-oxoglutarate aldolase